MAHHDTLPTMATEGFKDAAAYDQFRPSYPPAAVDLFLQRLRVAGGRDARVVEVAAGTGKFTRSLASRPEQFLVKAIEPHDGMRGRLVENDYPAVEVVPGRADQMPVADEWGDACIAAQAFHWFATREALVEIHRVLRPGAVFGMIWNIEDYNKPAQWKASTKWEQKLNEWVHQFQDGQPRFRHLAWREVFENQPPGNPLQVIKNTLTDHLPRFSLPIGEESVPFTVWLTEEGLWSRLQTLSQIAVLQGKEREDARAFVQEALKGDDVERNDKGEIAIHGVTYFAWTDRL